MRLKEFICAALALFMTLAAACFPAEKEAESAPATDPYSEEFLLGREGGAMAELKYSALHLFEQKLLPGIVFEHEQEFAGYIRSSDADKAREFILGIWALSASNAILNGLNMSAEEYASEDEELLWEYINDMRGTYDLGDEQIVSITIEELGADAGAVIVKMSDTGLTLLSTYIAIAHSNAGLRYFTLEMSPEPDSGGEALYMFCYADLYSRGTYYEIENNKEAFIAAIKDELAQAHIA